MRVANNLTSCEEFLVVIVSLLHLEPLLQSSACTRGIRHSVFNALAEQIEYSLSAHSPLI